MEDSLIWFISASNCLTRSSSHHNISPHPFIHPSQYLYGSLQSPLPLLRSHPVGVLYSCSQRLDLVILLHLYRQQWRSSSQIELIVVIAIASSIGFLLLFLSLIKTLRITHSQSKLIFPSMWLSNLFTIIACLLPIFFQLSFLTLIASESLFILGEYLSGPNLSLLTFHCTGSDNFLSQVATNESYRQLGSFLLSLVVYFSFVTSTSCLDSAGFVCIIMRLLSTIATMFMPIEDLTYWESLEEPTSPSHLGSSQLFSQRETRFFLGTIFCLFFFNSFFTFILIRSIFISTRDADISTTYWILSLVITQATMVGVSLLTSILMSGIGKKNIYVLVSTLISVRGGMIYLLLQYSSPLNHILLNNLVEGYSLGLLNVLVIIDSEILSRFS